MNEPTVFPSPTLFTTPTSMNENTTESITAPVTIAAPETKAVFEHTTIALSILVHGEAVRFNRGKGRAGDFDFKYMKGARGEVYPYVSAQCFKKYWRESLPTIPSPIIRGKNAKGEEKNQAATSGNPFAFVDDDLFGYMIAGAEAEAEAIEEAGDEEKVAGVEEVDAALEALLFSDGNVKDAAKLLTRFRDGGPLGTYLESHIEETTSEFFAIAPNSEPPIAVVDAMISALNSALKDTAFASSAGVVLSKPQQKKIDAGKTDEIAALNQELLFKVFSKELKKEDKKKRETTRRTAPIRMHALLAFSGIKTAQDFQTFSRDISLSGKNSILNPNPVGLYSGWLKTRILIEASRIGKFYVGPNLDVLANETEAHAKSEEENPYDRAKSKVAFIQLDAAQRQERLKMAIEALANVGNNQGPASGALHDGSLKPKAFIGAVMKCADSPFDSLWQGTSEQPELDLMRLEVVLSDWEDLFFEKTIYVGLPVELYSGEIADAMKADIEARALKHGFTALVGSPRKMLLQFAAEAAHKAIPV